MNESTKNILKKMFHDLNNVLCACSGYAEMLIADEDRPRQKKLLTKLLKCINRIVKIIEELFSIILNN
jgi:signal transduction histidine kinase